MEWGEESTTDQLDSYLPTTNPYFVEEEKEYVDGEFQESEFVDKEFEHWGVEDEDLLQGFVDWDSPPTYDDDVNEEDPIEEPLASNLEEEYEEYGLRPIFGSLYPEEDDPWEEGEHKEDGFFPMFDGLYPEEDDQGEEEEPTDDIANYEEVNEGLSGEVPNYNEEEVEYVDFHGVENILNSPNNDFGEFYADKENYMFTKKIMADPFLSIFMAQGRTSHFIVVCYLIVILRNGEWNALIGQQKDRGKDSLNLGRILFNLGRMM